MRQNEDARKLIVESEESAVFLADCDLSLLGGKNAGWKPALPRCQGPEGGGGRDLKAEALVDG